MRHLGYIILTAVLVVCFLIGSVGVFLQDDISAAGFAYICASLLTGAIVVTYLIASKTCDPFSPMMVVLYSVMIGSVLRAPYIVLYNDTSNAARFIMFGYTFDDIYPLLLITPIGISALIIGYACASGLNMGRRTLSRMPYILLEYRLIVAALVISIASLMGLILYAQAHGINISTNIASLSAKRAQAFEGSGGVVYGAGWQLFLARLSIAPFVLTIVLLASKSIRPRISYYFIVVISGFTAIFIPYLSSSRTDYVQIAIIVMGSLYYANKIKMKWLLVGLIAVTLSFSALGNLRSANQNVAKSYSNVMDSFLGSGNGLDSYRTPLIAVLSEDRIDMQFGATLAGTFSFLIPRAVWPEKPNPALGPWVKQSIFNQQVRNNGWPPGIIAEGWINARYLGVISIPFFYGIFLRIYYNSFRPFLSKSVTLSVIYCSALLPLAFSGVSYNVALGINQAVFALVPMLILVLAGSLGAGVKGDPVLQNRFVRDAPKAKQLTAHRN